VSQVDPTPSTPPAAAAPQVVYVAKQNRVTQLLLFVLVLAVLTVIGMQVWPLLNLKLGSSKEVSREELINQLEPEAMITPNGRKLELVEMGGKLFEITRIVFDGTDGKRGLVSITVPGKPPQQGIYRVGDSFDRGRMTVKEIGDGYVVLKCEGEQRTFGVQGAMPDEKNTSADITVTPGTHMMPPRDLATGDIPPAPTGRVKAPENPVPPKDEAKTVPKTSETEALISPYTVSRDEWRDFVGALPIYFGREMVLQTYRDVDSMRPIGLEIVNIGGYAKFAVYGFRAGDVITRISETELRGPADVDEALKQSFRDKLEIELWRGEELYLYRFEPGDSRLPKKSDK
jgi:hypothetical protein